MRKSLRSMVIAAAAAVALTVAIAAPASATTTVYHTTATADGAISYSSVYTVTGAYMSWAYPGSPAGPTDFTIEIATQSTSYVTYTIASGHAGPLNYNHPGQANHRSFCDWRYNLGNDPNPLSTRCEVKH